MLLCVTFELCSSTLALLPINGFLNNWGERLIEDFVLSTKFASSRLSSSYIPFPAGLQGKYDEAGPLYRRSLAIRENALGPDHPDVGQSLNNLALLMGKQVRHVRPLIQVSCSATPPCC